jgi:hypothetical protein
VGSGLITRGRRKRTGEIRISKKGYAITLVGQAAFHEGGGGGFRAQLSLQL